MKRKRRRKPNELAQVNLRLSPALLGKLNLSAASKGVSRNAEIIRRLESASATK